MQPRTSATRYVAAIIGVALLGCRHVALDNPLTYAEVPPAERIHVPCYYAIEPATDAIEVENLGYQVKLGPALAGQLQAALGGLCRGTGRVTDRAEFLSLTGSDPAVLFQISAAAEMNARVLTWAVNTGELHGHALVGGPSDGPLVPYEFSATGSKRQYYAEAGSGAEGLRHALGAAVQSLVDQARADRARLEALARSTNGTH